MKHSKNLLIAIAAASLFTAALPGYATKQGKVEINHCGCSDDGSTLEWRIDNVNRNSCNKPTGHNRHTDGSSVTCIDSTDGDAEKVYIRDSEDTLAVDVAACGSIDTFTAEDGNCED